MEEEEDEEFHACEADEVDDGLLQPPAGMRWSSVVAGFDGFLWSGERGVAEGFVEDTEEEVEDGDAEGGLGDG